MRHGSFTHRLYHLVIALVAYVVVSVIFMTLGSVFWAIIGLFIGGGIALAFGVFNGTGLEYVYLTASDMAEVLVFGYIVWSVVSLLTSLEPALSEYFKEIGY